MNENAISLSWTTNEYIKFKSLKSKCPKIVQ